MLAKLTRSIFVIFLVSLSYMVQGRHIIGGEVTYQCLGSDTLKNEVTFRFTCTVYRDCFGGGAEFDPSFEFGIYYNTNSGWRLFDAVVVNVNDIKNIDIDDSNPCVILPPNVCVEKGVYSFTRTLPMRSTNYMVAFQRCCRNNTISNIFNPGDQGAAYTVEITPPAQRQCNNSPEFKSFPPIVICANQPLKFDHGAVDAEGDILVYEFCTPLTAGGQLGTAGPPCPPTSCQCVIPNPRSCLPPFDEVVFKPPNYSSIRPIPGNPIVQIDPVTGVITGEPNEIGQFVVGVCVKEFRNGILLTTFRREFQFNVAVCEPTVVASVEANGTSSGDEFVINSCGENVINFRNTSFLEQFIVDYFWAVDVNGNIDTFKSKNLTYEFPGIGQYRVIMAINRGFECADTADIIVNIYPDIMAEFEYDYDTCFAGPVIFNDLSVSGSGVITNWDWNFDDGGISTLQNPRHTFLTPGKKNIQLTVVDTNDCEDQVVAPINYFPVPPVIIIEPTTFIGCVPATIQFVNLSVPIDDTYDIQWDFGDGGTGDEISPTHTYTNPGTYNIKISIKSPIGCFTSAEFNSWITIEPSPVANFDYNPKELSNFQKNVYFTDLSTGAANWQWTFDDADVLFSQNPSYTFQDTGRHKIELIVTHPSGCPDTIVKIIDVVPVSTYYMPNAFTPNRDGKNDIFSGVGVTEGMSNFSFSIWNRWGERVFLTDDTSKGWNGKKNNTGLDSPEGVYIYKVEYVGPRGGEKSLKGYVTLIR